MKGEGDGGGGGGKEEEGRRREREGGKEEEGKRRREGGERGCRHSVLAVVGRASLLFCCERPKGSEKEGNAKERKQ